MHSVDLIKNADIQTDIDKIKPPNKLLTIFKKLTKLIILLFVLGSFLSRYFIYIDISDKCFVKIYPSFLEFNNRTVMGAISILKHAANADYNDLCTNVATINPNPNCGGYDGGCFYENKPSTIYANISQRNPSLTAAVLIHEVCHVKQFKEGRDISEDECYNKDNQMLKKLVQP